MTITIHINTQPHSPQAGSTLANVQTQLELPVQGCVFAINDQVIPRGLWHQTVLNDGDHISLFQAIAGG
ncbi:sulfur carrier protein ThiS [Vibrio fluvialis]|uniref:sulfur carrier protein ThiS n=1 Tax=Vibrio fluvialis TaxID=676 RepID=UPI001EEA2B73|nr:sulfur carrier protein ThiS [Vibrio fluvialis]EKO3444338.1 sulfur carrier protein ThiS [Vibrio fluvialis]EKO3996892.1 sulfur carrier protein ThiS [Vibrio fluvialis]MCG6405180.1 sulfur carrier protein ThiS [Vibrio fluvialis]